MKDVHSLDIGILRLAVHRVGLMELLFYAMAAWAAGPPLSGRWLLLWIWVALLTCSWPLGRHMLYDAGGSLRPRAQAWFWGIYSLHLGSSAAMALLLAFPWGLLLLGIKAVLVVWTGRSLAAECHRH